MSYLDPDIMTVLEPDLMPGEKVLWVGRPNPKIIFRAQDGFMVPFSLMWGGFAIFWELGVLGMVPGMHSQNPAPLFMALWGIPFVVIGQYLIWGRFLVTGWKKKRTFYAVTETRVIAVQTTTRRRVAASFIDTLPVLRKEDGRYGTSTLRFADSQYPYRRNNGLWDAMSMDGNTPAFIDIDDGQSVYQLIYDQREKSRKAKASC